MNSQLRIAAGTMLLAMVAGISSVTAVASRMAPVEEETLSGAHSLGLREFAPGHEGMRRKGRGRHRSASSMIAAHQAASDASLRAYDRRAANSFLSRDVKLEFRNGCGAYLLI